MPRRAPLLLAALLAAFLCGGANAQPAHADTFESANALYREAVSKLAADPDGAKADFRRAAGMYQSILDAGVDNGRLHYNLANAHLRAGDIGRAILHYKRAAALMPGNADIQSNLAFARAQTRDRIPASAARAATRTLLFWHYDIPGPARWWVFVASWAVLWLALGARLLKRAAPLWLAGIAATLALLFGGSLYADHAGIGRPAEGVVVAAEVVGRKGPDALGYEPSFTAPLHAGTEFVALERRADWIRVRLADDRETWLPRAAVELVHPEPAPAADDTARD